MDPVAPAVLTEDQVIDAVRDYLVRRSWCIVARATALQRGDEQDRSRPIEITLGELGDALEQEFFNQLEPWDAEVTERPRHCR